MTPSYTPEVKVVAWGMGGGGYDSSLFTTSLFLRRAIEQFGRRKEYPKNFHHIRLK